MPFLLLLCSRFLCCCWNTNRAGKTSYILLITLYLGGNSANITDFIQYGRGRYLNALKYIAAESKTPEISVSSDHDFRNMMLINYYRQYLPGNARIQYYKKDAFWHRDPEWLILHSDEKEATAPPSLFSKRKNRFDLVRHFPFSGISGWHWFIYHNTAYMTSKPMPP
ncbi:MAG TPA: hypothetical protein ENI99_11965 [Sedimenticola sp.]|nr:hypothetical protein [Sedimenticola sp.]